MQVHNRPLFSQNVAAQAQATPTGEAKPLGSKLTDIISDAAQGLFDVGKELTAAHRQPPTPIRARSYQNRNQVNVPQHKPVTFKDPRTGKQWTDDSGAKSNGYGVLSPDGSSLAYGCYFDLSVAHTFVRVVDSASGKLLKQFDLANGAGSEITFNQIAFSPDGSRLGVLADTRSATTQNQWRVYDAKSGECLAAQRADDIYMDGNGRRAVLFDYTTEQGTVIDAFDPCVQAVTLEGGVRGMLNEFALSASGAIAAAHETGRIHFWNAQGQKIGEEWNVSPGHGLLQPMAHPTQELAVTTSGGDAAAVWDMKTGKKIHDLPISGKDSVGFTADGLLAVTKGFGARAVLWDIEKNEPVRRARVEVQDTTYVNDVYRGAHQLRAGR
jgi:WD40 repeat protein